MISYIYYSNGRNILLRAYSSAPIQEKTIKLDKWNVNYVKVGKGPHHVFCLPGALGTIWTDFKPQIEGFDKEKFTLVVWDPPGYGKSRPPDKDFTGNHYIRDAYHAFLFMRALEIPKYSIMGWSDGGAAALIHAAKYPEVTEKLVIIAAGAAILPENIAFVKKLRDLNNWSKNMRKTMTEVYGDALSSYWNRWIDDHEAFLRASGGDVCTDSLKDIKCPTLIINGGKDSIAHPRSSINLVKNILGSRSHVYPEGNHDIHLRYAEDFNKRVQAFLLEP